MPATKGHRGWGHIRQLPNKSKRFQASFIGPDLNRHTAPVTFTERMNAEVWLAKERDYKERCILSGETWTSPAARAALVAVTGETVSDYGKRWIDQRNIKDRTRIHYTSILETHIGPKLGKLAISALTPATVRTWYAGTLVDKPTMRAHAYQLLHAICSTAVKDGLLQRNPCLIDGATAVKKKTEPLILGIDELAVVADKIEPQRFKALVLISAWCGLRYGEVSELRRRDIGENCEVITVARGATHRTTKQADGKSRCMIDTPKSGKARVVVTPPHIRADIAKHLEKFVDGDSEALLFGPVRGGCHLSDKVLRDALAPALQAAGKPGVRIHDLRHFAGTQAARVGNLVETMARLGHSTVSASLRYQHMVSRRDYEMAEAMSGLATHKIEPAEVPPAS